MHKMHLHKILMFVVKFILPQCLYPQPIGMNSITTRVEENETKERDQVGKGLTRPARASRCTRCMRYADLEITIAILN